MLSLIVILLFSLGIAYFALQNPDPVSFVVGNFQFNEVPLYFVVIGSMLIGILLAALIHSISMLSGYLMLRRHSKTIAQDKETIHSLQQRNHELEKENQQLLQHQPATEHEEHSEHKPSFGEVLKSKFTPARG